VGAVGFRALFALLAAVGALATALVVLAVPETLPGYRTTRATDAAPAPLTGAAGEGA
jgi:hypothetical protein